MTSPERAETVVDACERELRRWIVRGEVGPGERLPPERALAMRLGVNRTTLRSALTRLVAKRLLRVRQGSGYVVGDIGKVAGLELLSELASDDASLARVAADLLRVRRALVGLALARASMPDALLVASQVARLRELIDDGAPCGEIVDGEHEILVTLLSAGPTPILSLSCNSVFFAIRAMPRVCEALCAKPSALIAFVTSVQRCVDSPSPAAAEAVLTSLARRDATVVRQLVSKSPRAVA